MTKDEIRNASDHELATRWDELDRLVRFASGSTYENSPLLDELQLVEYEQDRRSEAEDRHRKEEHEDTPSLDDPWWANP